jgi:hypothetical protein
MNDNVKKAKKKTADVKRVEDFLSTEYVWLDELKQLSDSLPPADDVILTQLSMSSSPSGGQISLDGYTKESSQIKDVQRALRSEGRRVIPKGGGITAGRLEYEWQFRELVVLPPKTEFSANKPAEPTVVEAVEEAELPDEDGQETPDEGPSAGEPATETPTPDQPETQATDLEAAALNEPAVNLASSNTPAVSNESNFDAAATKSAK